MIHHSQFMDRMGPALYKAAAQGDIDPFEKHQTCLNQLLTPNKNTILLVYLESQSTEPEFTDFVDTILEMCPPLLLQANIKEETALHFAARYGHSNVVKLLIDRAKALPIDPESGVTEAVKMLRMANGEKDTALHVAARHRRSRVVEILTKEDPEFSYSSNVHGETPLYIAVDIDNLIWNDERRKVFDEILRNCISVDYGGPNGRTALHAAIMINDDETARKLLEKEKNLTKITDQNGWSPLHYAVYFSFQNTSAVKLVLEYDVSSAYIVETDKKRTALHIAAIQGYVDVMKEIVSRCPACCELVDNRGWNALHYVVASRSVEVFKICLKIPELGRLITEKDDKGNTPLHLIAALSYKDSYWRHFLYKIKYLGEEMEYGMNIQKLSDKDISQGKFAEKRSEVLESLKDVGSGPFGQILENQESSTEESIMERARDAHLIAATLIATVTFAAAFTLPGGYKSEAGPHQGTAVLIKKAAFVVFFISDAISMVLSLLAVFIHFLIAIASREELENDFKNFFNSAVYLTIFAMATMVIAFITGTYAVLEPSLGLAIITCLIGSSFYFAGFITVKEFAKHYM